MKISHTHWIVFDKLHILAYFQRRCKDLNLINLGCIYGTCRRWQTCVFSGCKSKTQVIENWNQSIIFIETWQGFRSLLEHVNSLRLGITSRAVSRLAENSATIKLCCSETGR